MKHRTQKFWGVQFHPEVTHTPCGVDILRNFLQEACGCTGSWAMADFLDEEVARVRKQVGKDRVICGLSGGVDSAVAAAAPAAREYATRMDEESLDMGAPKGLGGLTGK